MTESEALQRFAEAGVYPDVYSIGRDQDDTICLLQEATGDYTVYYSERGKRWDARTYISKSAALEELVHRVFGSPGHFAPYREEHPPPSL